MYLKIFLDFLEVWKFFEIFFLSLNKWNFFCSHQGSESSEIIRMFRILKNGNSEKIRKIFTLWVKIRIFPNFHFLKFRKNSEDSNFWMKIRIFPNFHHPKFRKNFGGFKILWIYFFFFNRQPQPTHIYPECFTIEINK